jgi:hypothetical protein
MNATRRKKLENVSVLLTDVCRRLDHKQEDDFGYAARHVLEVAINILLEVRQEEATARLTVPASLRHEESKYYDEFILPAQRINRALEGLYKAIASPHIWGERDAKKTSAMIAKAAKDMYNYLPSSQ